VFLEGTLCVHPSKNRGEEILHLLLVVASKKLKSYPESTYKSSNAQYMMICTVNWMKKSQNIPVWFRKLVLFSSPYHIIVYFAVAGRDIATACTCKKKECNK
jgi:hypothetical protein